MGAKKTIERGRVRRGLLQNALGDIDERRTTAGKKRRHQPHPAAINEIERTAVGIENADRTFDDQPMQIVWPNDIAKGFPEPMEKIENQIFLDLNGFVRTLEGADAPTRALVGEQPAEKRSDKQPEEKKTHGAEARLLRRALVPKILFQIFEDILEAGNIFRLRFAEGFVCLKHRGRLFTLGGGRSVLFGLL